MLELIRNQQKTLMIAVAALVIVAFAFLYDSQSYNNQGRQGSTMVLYGKRISPNKFQNYLAQASFISSPRMLQVVFNLGLGDLYFHLRGNQRSQGDVQDLITNLLVLRQEAEDLGIKASDEEIAEAIKEARFFANQQTQQFDEALFSDFKANLGNTGITEADFQQLVADSVVLEKMRNLLKAGLRPSQVTLDSTFNEQNASVAAFRLDFAAEKYAKGAEDFTEEELKEFYEDRKADYQSPEKRNVQFVHFSRPDLEKKLEEAKKAAEEKQKAEETSAAIPPPPVPAPIPEKSSEPQQAKPDTESDDPVEESAPESEDDADAPKEQKQDAQESAPDKSEKGGKEAELRQEADADAAGVIAAPEASAPTDQGASASEVGAESEDKEEQPAEEPATEPVEGETGPSSAELNSEFGKVMNSFISEAAGNLEDFPALAKKYSEAAEGKFYAIDYVETGLFTRDDPPASLLQNNGEPEQLILQSIFQRPAAQPFQSEAPRDMDSGFVVFRLLEVVPPQEKTFEEAKEKVTEAFIQDRQSEMLREAAEEVRSGIVEAVQGGKAFEDAAKEAGAEYISIPRFTMTSPPVGVEDWGMKFADKVKNTPAGQMTEPVAGDDKVTMIYVAARELREVDAEATKRDSLQDQISSQYYENLVFQSWLEEARNKAGAFKGDLGLGS
ncbi:MAG: SurA N-terminal domain-containing protein [Verrucomicrobiota bacterium]